MTLDVALAPARRVPLLPVLIAVYAGIAALLWPERLGDMVWMYAREASVMPVLVGIGLFIAAFCVQPRSPLQYIRDRLRQAGLRFLAVFVAFCIGLAAFTTFKIGIPSLVPFYADPILADIDAALHGGNPGELAHAVLPDWAEYPLAMLYGPMWFLQWFCLMALVALYEDRMLRRRYYWAMALTVCLLGTVSAIVFSSVGPVMYEPIYEVDRFATLMQMVAGSAAGEHMQRTVAYLLANYRNGGHDVGTGISAMPSMHLAIATLNALMLRRISRLGSNLAWGYVGCLLFGSVYLGWHYALDGYYSIAAVLIIWWAAGKIARPNAPSPQ